MTSADTAVAARGDDQTRLAPDPAFDQRRRLSPRLWDTDWLVLRGMRAVIEAQADNIANAGQRVVDFGCGIKPYASLFTGRGLSYRGADFGPGHDIEIGTDGRLGAPDHCADLVTSFQVLEHVRDLDMYLAEARRVLTDDGLLLLSTHGTWLYHPHPEDHRRWTREGLVNDISSRGFEVISCEPVVGPLGWTTMVRLTCVAVAVRKIPVVGPGLANCIAVVMNAKAWAEDKITPAWVTRDNACVYVTVSRKAAQSHKAGLSHEAGAPR